MSPSLSAVNLDEAVVLPLQQRVVSATKGVNINPPYLRKKILESSRGLKNFQIWTLNLVRVLALGDGLQ